MKTIIKIFLVSILLITTNFSQQDLGDGWQILGQVMLRSELDGRDFSNSTHPLTFASSRIRFGIAKTFDEKVQLFIHEDLQTIVGSELYIMLVLGTLYSVTMSLSFYQKKRRDRRHAPK